MTDDKDDALTAAYMAGFEEGKASARREQAALIRQLVDALQAIVDTKEAPARMALYGWYKQIARNALAAAKEAGY